MIAPAEEPALRVSSRKFSQRPTIWASGQKNGFSPTAFQSQRLRSIACGPICTNAPRTFTLSPKIFTRGGAGGDTRRGFARRGAAAAAVVADAVFGPIGVIGVAGTELVLDRVVILGARVLVG